MTVERYVHHGKEVAVLSEGRGKHRERCLCYQGCRFFKPGQIDNCPIAQKLYELCVEHNLTTPVVECATYEVAP